MRCALALILCVAAWAGDWVPIEVVATAYCPCRICCGDRAAGITADNTKVRDEPYGIASDPEKLPYDTWIYIPQGNGYLDRCKPNDDDRMFRVDDTGGTVRTKTRETGIIHIDLRYKGHADAKRFGKKTITIYKWVP